MKLIKGILLGTAISAGIAFACSGSSMSKRTIMRKGRKIAKKMGIM